LLLSSSCLLYKQENSLNALVIDEPLECACLTLDGKMQVWVDAIDSLKEW